MKIGKNGELLDIAISKSSHSPLFDEIAEKAAEISAPFKPLPEEFSGQFIDIEFTFDARMFNQSDNRASSSPWR